MTSKDDTFNVLLKQSGALFKAGHGFQKLRFASDSELLYHAQPFCVQVEASGTKQAH